jgi:hypothetical protein
MHAWRQQYDTVVTSSTRITVVIKYATVTVDDGLFQQHSQALGHLIKAN